MRYGAPLVLALLLGCVDHPSEFDGRLAMQNLHEEVLTIGIFLQSDTRRYTKDGVERYEIDYHLEGEWVADVRVTEDGRIRKDGAPGAEGTLYLAGEPASLNGTCVFEKVEGGWKAPDGRIYP